MRRLLILLTVMLLLAGTAAAQSHGRGYYKDLFMDSGIMLTSRTDLPVAELLGLSMEAFISTRHSYTEPYRFTATDTLRQRELIAGSPVDENGILLYPDGQPRFRMVYMNGGRAGKHGTSLEEAGRQAYRDFVSAGGSYLGSCAGAFLASGGVLSPGSGKIEKTDVYLGLWPGYTTSTELNNSFTALDLEPGRDWAGCFDPGAWAPLDSTRHNGGCFAAEPFPSGTEVLARYNTGGRKLERNINGLPCIWAYKASGESGRIILCGSHPEGAREGANLNLMAALVRYALAGNGTPRLKAQLRPGEARNMADRGNPAYAPLGDRQYHHFCIDVPDGVGKMVVDLKGVVGSDDFDLYLFAGRDGFAYGDNAAWRNIGERVDKKLEIASPKPGKYYISVFCATTVISSMGKYGVEYSGRTDVLNGVPYTIKVTFE